MLIEIYGDHMKIALYVESGVGYSEEEDEDKQDQEQMDCHLDYEVVMAAPQ